MTTALNPYEAPQHQPDLKPWLRRRTPKDGPISAAESVAFFGLLMFVMAVFVLISGWTIGYVHSFWR